MNAGQTHAIHRSEHLVDGLHVVRVRSADQEDPAILMLPGAWHGSWLYSTWLGSFASLGWDAYSMSFRNHHRSYAVPDKQYVSLRATDYIYDIGVVLDWIGRPLVILGHSMAGVLSQKIAEVRGAVALVLVNSTGPMQLGPIRDVPFNTDAPLQIDADLARRWFFPGADDEEFRAWYALLSAESPSVVNDTGGAQISVDPAKVTCSVLVVNGEADATNTLSQESLATYYDADLMAVAGGGHDLMLETQAPDVASRIDRWLNLKGLGVASK